MINPRQLITRLRVVVERRMSLDAEFVPALEARDIQREINQMLEQYIAEQQPSVKAGQGHIEPVMTSALAAVKQKEFCDGYDTALIGVLGGLDSPKASAPNVSMVDVRDALAEHEAKVRADQADKWGICERHVDTTIADANVSDPCPLCHLEEELAKAEAALAEAQKDAEHWHSHYDAAMGNWKTGLDELDVTHKQVATLQGALRWALSEIAQSGAVASRGASFRESYAAATALLEGK